MQGIFNETWATNRKALAKAGVFPIFAFECEYLGAILETMNLLTKTDHEWANEWRKACRKNAEDKAFRAKLARLPIGTEIEWQLDDDEQISIGNPGDRYTLVREQVGKQKRWMLYYPGGRGYVPPKWLNRNNVTIKSQPTAA